MGFRGDRHTAGKRLLHTLGDIDQTGAATVDYARLLEHVEQIRRALQRAAKLIVKIFKIGFKSARAGNTRSCIAHRFAVYGEDRTLYRNGYRAV